MLKYFIIFYVPNKKKELMNKTKDYLCTPPEFRVLVSLLKGYKK